MDNYLLNVTLHTGTEELLRVLQLVLIPEHLEFPHERAVVMK